MVGDEGVNRRHLAFGESALLSFEDRHGVLQVTTARTQGDNGHDVTVATSLTRASEV